MRTAFIFGAALLVAGCNPDPETLKFTGQTMGTTYNVVAIDPEGGLEADDVQAAIEATLVDVNAKMSNWDPNSEISRFNSARTIDAVPISSDLFHVMEAANEVHFGSEGQFDVTLGPLIELWGFGDRDPETPIPSDEDIRAAMKIVGQSHIVTLTQTPPTLAKSLPDTSIYLAAIAKGYGVDRVADTLAQFGLTDYLVEIGGDLVTSGKNPAGDAWRIGVERPDGNLRAVEEVLAVSDLGMATSGDYRNYFEHDGVRYSHIIDANTGHPIRHQTASVTVLAPNAMLADGWATALLALGAERGLSISEERDLAVLFLVRDSQDKDGGFKMVASSRFEALRTAK